ncbi:phosphoadenylyl-sulfate reductase [Kurthia gibsonii]|uniref:phosphoadenylyl-sulfate reductase n=1 Tax=Kurthia gibsonii TaxID=33946 RepID=UPI000B3F170D|nr:phosphoadenylyl-sulfate reductase [Kurthia gibsonii]MEB6111903.1 phosphoadenylyl-sulfate reductase [Kurthia gibsonii]RXH53549.1 phosphoadenylyl-sulfate reductase [Kurthia gibsonii]HZG11823.1 phosphoadenylyl-sulfate reductase [Kurthia gibsonii]
MTQAEITPPLFSKDTDTKGALEVLEWAYETYGDKLVYACSFGIEGIVLIHLIAQVKPDAKIVFLDTDLHFKETYETIERTKERYPTLQIELKKPTLTLEEQANEYGDELWKTAPNQCCNIRKIEPLQEVLQASDAWISGLRREQSETRAKTEFVNDDPRFKSTKICPLIHWTWKDVWRYVSKYDLPYNILHDQGYPSIGCEKCTVPAFTMDDLRSGRWQGKGKTECGLHG